MCGIEKCKDFGDQQQSTATGDARKSREAKMGRDSETYAKDLQTTHEKLTKNLLKTAKIPVKWHRL
jgi:hypothetical protein